VGLCELASDVLLIPDELRLPQGFDTLVGVVFFEEEGDEDGLLSVVGRQ
jgi:hypothetical protein